MHTGIDWSGFNDSTSFSTAGFFTPYNIACGGGERYLLSSVKAAQALGFHTEILVTSSNTCKSKEGVLDVAGQLRVALNETRLSFRVVSSTSSSRIASPNTYDLFFLLGNEKYPMYKGLGRLNMYMCQFPFDLASGVDAEHVGAFASYHYVLLNSIYSQRWYQALILPVLQYTLKHQHYFPSMEILYPAVIPFAPTGSTERKNIVLLGRVFTGRQDKGHAAAIRVFRQLISKGEFPGVRLVLAGNVQAGHEAHAERLRQDAKGLPVDFLFGGSSDKLQDALQSSLVQWHMTGLVSNQRDQQNRSDPADVEHFGISIIEGMSAGCIPIAYCVGGATDFIHHNVNGFLACSEHNFLVHTRKLLSSHSDDLEGLRRQGQRTAERFTASAFEARFATFVFRGFTALTFNHFLKQLAPVVNALPIHHSKGSEKYTAVIVEGRVHFAFGPVCRKTMWHLGRGWSLHVFHSQLNGPFVKQVLRGVQPVVFQELTTQLIDIAYYNQMLKSTWFWQQFQAEKVLIFQVDTLLLRPGIEEFLHYDYIGAPWHAFNQRWTGWLRDVLPDGVGNGGFSFRSVNASLAVVRQYGNSSPTNEQEDVFFAQGMRRLGYLVADRIASYRFCLEVPCQDLLEDNFLALHATWSYAPRLWLKHAFHGTLLYM